MSHMSIFSYLFCFMLSQPFVDCKFDRKMVDVNNPISKIPTVRPVRPTIHPTVRPVRPTSIPTKYSRNSTVKTVFYDSSRNFTKWIFPSKKVSTTTYAKSVLSTQIFIESDDDSAISIIRGKRKPTTAPTAKFTSSPTKAPAKSLRISPTLLPTKQATTLNALPTVSPTKVVQSPTVAPSPTRTPTLSSKSSLAPKVILSNFFQDFFPLKKYFGLLLATRMKS